MNQPIISYDFSLPDAAAAGGWHNANNYNLWVGCQKPTDPEFRVYVRRSEGVFYLPSKPRLMHCIEAGTPFRVAHLFGAWRVSDADIIYLRASVGDDVYHTLLAAQSRDVKRDYLLWVCPACNHEIERHEYDTRKHGLTDFWKLLGKEYRGFNEAVERRTCSVCGNIHPLAYGFDALEDDDAGALARQVW